MSIDSGSVSVSRAFLLFGLSSRNISLALVHISMGKSDQLQIGRIYEDMARALLMKCEIVLLPTSQCMVRHHISIIILEDDKVCQGSHDVTELFFLSFSRTINDFFSPA